MGAICVYTYVLLVGIYAYVYIYVHRWANRFSVSNKTAMQSARACSREWTKGINATLIETAPVDCDMLAQPCRKYNAASVNRVYLTKKKEQKTKANSMPKRGHFFTLSLPLPNAEGNSLGKMYKDATAIRILATNTQGDETHSYETSIMESKRNV